MITGIVILDADPDTGNDLNPKPTTRSPVSPVSSGSGSTGVVLLLLLALMALGRRPG
jgi:hypothetical protein